MHGFCWCLAKMEYRILYDSIYQLLSSRGSTVATFLFPRYRMHFLCNAWNAWYSPQNLFKVSSRAFLLSRLSTSTTTTNLGPFFWCCCACSLPIKVWCFFSVAFVDVCEKKKIFNFFPVFELLSIRISQSRFRQLFCPSPFVRRIKYHFTYIFSYFGT